MKNIWLVGATVLVLAIVAAVTVAVYTGEKSKIIIAGKIKIAPHLQAKAKRISTLYIVLRDAQASHPMPYGAYVDRAGDYNFLLTKDNIQLMGMGAGADPISFNIKARLDVDGKAGADQPGDLVGELTNVASGSADIVVNITREVSAPN